MYMASMRDTGLSTCPAKILSKVFNFLDFTSGRQPLHLLWRTGANRCRDIFCREVQAPYLYWHLVPEYIGVYYKEIQNLLSERANTARTFSIAMSMARRITGCCRSGVLGSRTENSHRSALNARCQ